MPDTRYFHVEGVSRPIAITNGEEILSLFERVLKGWRVEQAGPPKPSIDPTVSLTVAKREKRWRCASTATGKSTSFSDPVSAMCWLAANIVRVQTLENPDLLCLHAASVEIGDGLIVMPSRYRAGKSVLTAVMTALGRRAFGDDILPLDPATGEGVAAGVAPRLRLPTPAKLEPQTHAFIDRHAGPRGKRYLYLDLPEAKLAPRGTRLPIRGIALLEREDGGAAKLTRVAPGDALKQIIWQNFSREGAAGTILDRLAEITRRAPCVKLRYSNPEEAAGELIAAFGAASIANWPTEPFALDAERKSRSGKSQRLELDPECVISRVAGCELHTREQRHFLIGAEGLTIMALNELGAALWRLIESPTRYTDVLALVVAAFPEEDEERLDADLKALIAAFVRNNVATTSDP